MTLLKPVAIVGIGAILPDAFDVSSFWKNILAVRNSIRDVNPERWNPDLYFDTDRSSPDKTYTKIGAWVDGYHFDPMKLRMPIPPTVLKQMDQTQQWSIAASHQALSDFGYPQRSLDPERVAVIFGNAMAGEKHYRSTMRILFPEYATALQNTPAFQNLPQQVQQTLIAEMQQNIRSTIADITEDTMPGELSNIIAGRVANIFNFSGPNYVTDAACASSFAAMQSAIQGLNSYQFDAVLTGGVDRNMGVESYVKFCKIGALSPDGSRPYADGANGFVMGEGAAIFLLKRLEDAERDGDKIYAVIRGIGSSSDGKGKGITAPNPVGQVRAIERAWLNAGVSPFSVGLIEGHGTSTKVGDVVEVNSLNEVFGKLGKEVGSIALGSVKSNIGHLKSAAGAASVIKVAMALYEKILPPSANFHKPNPNINFAELPFAVNTEARPWENEPGQIRRAGISAFGFGGTNFHFVLEEYVPGVAINENKVFSAAVAAEQPVPTVVESMEVGVPESINVENEAAITQFVLQVVSEKTGYPQEMLDVDLDLEADLGIDTVKQAELFATIRENYGIPRREDLRLSDYNTLTKVVGFVQNSLGSLPKTVEPVNRPDAAPVILPEVELSQSEHPVTQGSVSRDSVEAFVLSQVAEKTGYPVEMLDLDLDLEADLGVDTVKQAELFATIRENYGVARREDLRLSDYNTLAKVVDFFVTNAGAGQEKIINDSTPDAQPVEPTQPDVQEHFRGLFFIGTNDVNELKTVLIRALGQAKAGYLPPSKLPSNQEVSQPERLVIDYGTPEEFIKRAERALTALDTNNPSMWQALTAQGVHRGSGAPGKVAFLFPGQGSQYVNMLRELRDIEPVIDETFAEADRVMTPLLGKPLTHYIYADGDKESLKAAEAELKNTEITQPAVLTANVAMLRLLKQYGFQPDMVIGHSLGEYAALVAAGVLTFAEALEVVSARGREMTKVSMEDNGCMAAVSAPIEEIQRLIETVDEYVVLANLNSPTQSVIAGSTKGVDAAIEVFKSSDYQAVKIPVSHAFHTKIVAPASKPLRSVIDRMNIQAPRLPIAANVTGDWYPVEREAILDMLADQVASPVQFIKGIQKLYESGARVFIESGPKRVLNALSSDILKEQPVSIVATNHPRKGALPSFNEALCALFAAGVLRQFGEVSQPVEAVEPVEMNHLEENIQQEHGISDGRVPLTGSVVISGAALGLPGISKHVFEEDSIQAILHGEVRIEQLSAEKRNQMVNRRVTRLIKSEAGAVMKEIESIDETVQLAGQRGAFDLAEEFGVPADRVEAIDISTQLAIAAGIDALRDAGIPLVMNHRRTSKGTYLPDRWMLPPALQDETGVVFASAFPGLDRMAEASESYYEHKTLIKQLNEVRSMLSLLNGDSPKLRTALESRENELKEEINQLDYHFDRRFIFRILAMGHSQFAEYIGAKGPNTYVNAACATTTHAVSVAEDWIRSGRCRRVVIIAGDDVTGGNLVNWIGTGLLASGATTTETNIRMAALPFDRRRNGMIMGMGAAALVLEAEDAIRERGMVGIAELLSSQIANSAFHGTRLDVPHVSRVMDRLIQQAERRFGINRYEIADKTVFVSHETYTPARGGSAAAEIQALRQTFGDQANKVVIANTKGFTGHTMGVGIEDVMAVKALEYGIVPPIAHYDDQFEPDPDLGDLNLSHGGQYPVEYALRLGAGFGSQIAMTLIRKIKSTERINQPVYRHWIKTVAGYPEVELEVVQHTLRVKNQGPPQLEPAVSAWQFGQGPSAWVSQPEINQTENNQQKQQVVESISVEKTPIAPVVEKPITAPVQESESITDTEVGQVVLSLVSEKTGYPTEMLDMDLDLEADLGIDTVKQAELFASIREHYGIPRREDLRLSDYNTLSKVVGFVMDSRLPVQTKPTQEEQPEIAPTIAEITEQPADQVENLESEDADSIQSYVVSIVSEKTGYPAEMLDMDLDLEADLGIDTVKQAELFATIRENYGIPRREDLRLSEYNTLTKVVGFVKTALQQQKPPVAEETPISLAEEHYQTNSVNRRMPVAVLRPKLNLCKPSGIKIDASKRILVISDLSGMWNELVRKLQTHNAQVISLNSENPNTMIDNVKTALNNGAVHGLYYLPTLDLQPDFKTMNQTTWQNQQEKNFYNLVNIVRLMPELEFLVVGTRMDGLFGLSGNKISAPLGGAAAGFAKAIARERKNIFVKVVDFEEKATSSKVAERLYQETLIDAAVMEVAWEGEQRFTIVLREEETPEVNIKPLQPGSVFVISGGSGGIIAPISLDLAQATRGQFYLLGRSDLPPAEDAQLRMVLSDPETLKQNLMQKSLSGGEKLIPASINRKIEALQRAAATHQTISDIQKAGGTAVYLVCDVTDPAAVENAVEKIIQTSGRIDVLIHAAGLERSRKLESKSEEEIQTIFSIKVDGFYNLFKTMESKNCLPKAMVSFTSVAGRFGNAGQTDYSAANDALTRLTAAINHTYPTFQALALDWGAWAEVGMASRGHIPALMERAGIDLMNPQEAAVYVRRELEAGSRGEVILAGSLGLLEKQDDPDGGLDVQKANQALITGDPIHVMLSRLSGMSLSEGILLEAELDPTQEAFLKDHAMNGIPLLPGVMGIEGFSVAAQHVASVLATSQNGFRSELITDITFLTPFKFYRDEARKITWKAQVIREKSGLVAYVTLESTLARIQGKVDILRHFSGKVHLIPAEQPHQNNQTEKPHWNGAYTISAEDIYKLYFHGPSFQVLEGVQRSGDVYLGKLNKSLPPITSHQENLVSLPLLVELCLQTAGIYEIGASGALSLPHSIGDLKIYENKINGVPIFAEVKPQQHTNGSLSFDARVIDENGHIYLELNNYQTSPLPYGIEKELLSPIKRMMG